MSSPANYSVQDVLEVLAAQSVGIDVFEPNFEMLEEYTCFADARLSVLRSNQNWVIVIEVVFYSTCSEAFQHEGYFYGNCIKPQSWPPPLGTHLFEIDLATYFPEDSAGFGLIPRHKFSIFRRGKEIHFAPTDEDYAHAGLKAWSEHETEVTGITSQDVLRYLCTQMDFFASEDSLRRTIEQLRYDRQMNDSGEEIIAFDSELPGLLENSLELFLQTQQWTQPTWEGADVEAMNLALRP